ncbi:MULTISPECIES: hypothetical protein [unclassified Thermococcus]|nr:MULTISPECIES: hypothetical protein [unclassified Thermococcus]
MRNSVESNLKCTQKAYWNTNCGDKPLADGKFPPALCEAKG